MRIACPECNAAYDVPGTQLAPGRGVRCVRCGAVWIPVETEDAVPVIQPQSEPARRPAAPTIIETAAEPPTSEALPPETPTANPKPPTTARVVVVKPRLQRRAPPVLVGWLVTALVLAELAYVAAAYSGPIIRAWPPAERAYALFRTVQP